MSLSVAGKRHAQLGDSASEGIFRATQHVRRIAGRSHLKANRAERVDLFITSLRREIRNTAQQDALCRKDLWHDAGILEPNINNYSSGGYHGGTYTRMDIIQWVREAEEMLLTIRGAAEDIESDIACLGHDVAGIKIIAEKATRIADESTSVLDSIADTVLR